MKNLDLANVVYSVIIPVFNEEHYIPILFHSLDEVMKNLKEKYEIIFIDDGSSDCTWDRLNILIRGYSYVRLIHFDCNRGQGKAMEEGFRQARGETIITLDGDLQNDPLDIPKLIFKMHQGFDLVCGWRQRRSEAAFKKIKSRIGNFLQRKITRLDLHDISCTLRVYRRDLVKDVVFKGRFEFSILPYIILKTKKARIAEVEVRDNYRKFGMTKYKLLYTIIGTVWDYLRLAFYLKKIR